MNAKNHQREGAIIAEAGRVGAVTVATNMAGRGVDIALGGSLQNEEERKKVLDAGGLAVIGTERHEARRIDDQLRGRAGRQGDHGESQFFVSLADELMRVFGGDKIKTLMDTLKMPDDQPIQAGIISRSLEKAQARVEGFHFDSRKHILEYDNVIAKQRNKIYGLRDEILDKDYNQLAEFVLGIVKKEIGFILQVNENSLDELKTILPLSGNEKIELASLEKLATDIFKRREDVLTKEKWANGLRYACLSSIDFFWQEHLTTMDHLKEAVGIRAYGGKNPLVEYKSEGHRIFQKMQRQTESQIARIIFKISIK